MANGNSDSQHGKFRCARSTPPGTCRAARQHVAVVPESANVEEKLNTGPSNTGHSGASAAEVSSCDTFNSSTMIVMMMALTPSLKVPSQALPYILPLRASIVGTTGRLSDRDAYAFAKQPAMPVDKNLTRRSACAMPLAINLLHLPSNSLP